MWASTRETRCAKDGKRYTYHGFIDYYGTRRGSVEWDRADVQSLGALSEEARAARAMFQQLHKQVADEEQDGGHRTRFSILKIFVDRPTEELYKFISLYSDISAAPEDSKVESSPSLATSCEQTASIVTHGPYGHGHPLRPKQEMCALYSDISTAPEDSKVESSPSLTTSCEQTASIDTQGPYGHGHPLRPKQEMCAMYATCGQCEYGKECRYIHVFPPPPPEEAPTDDDAEEQAVWALPPTENDPEEAPTDDDAEAQAEETPPRSENSENGPGGQAVYCKDCWMWLNGPTQWEDHRIGKKHKKNNKPKSPAAMAAAREKIFDQVQQQQRTHKVNEASAETKPEETVAPTLASELLPDMQPQGYSYMQMPEEMPLPPQHGGMTQYGQMPQMPEKVPHETYAAYVQTMQHLLWSHDPWQQYYVGPWPMTHDSMSYRE
jgi:hypothetical protein